MYFDMTSQLYRSDVKIHALVLQEANCFLFCTQDVVQRSSLWSLLVSETLESSFSQVEALVQLISLCLIQICGIDYQRHQYDGALLKLDLAEQYCRDCGPVCGQRLVRCLRLRGLISQTRGNLIAATKALQEASSIAQSLDDLRYEALLNDSLACVFLSQGKIADAEHLFISAQEYYESDDGQSHLASLFISRGQIAVFRNEFPNARFFLSNAMELDHEHNGGRLRLHILAWKASCEGRAGSFAAARTILEGATKVIIGPGTPQFTYYVGAMRGKAYYEARLGRFEDARKTILHAIKSQQESGRDLYSLFVSACIELFCDGGQETAESICQMVVKADRGTSTTFAAIYRQTLGEMMLRNEKVLEAKAQFRIAKMVCDESGISPRHLYVKIAHWFSLPEEHDGWTRFLDGRL